jgi:hypothetical protein
MIIQKPETTDNNAGLNRLYDWAMQHFGVTPEHVRSVMKSHDLTTFHHDSWWTYTLLIVQDWLEAQARQEFPDSCPVCKSPVLRDHLKDGLFGVKFGWRCSANRDHFMTHRLNIIRAKRSEHEIRTAVAEQ